MMPESVTRPLNDDCWQIILSRFENDFQTLSKLMQVSRYFLAIAAPVLYGQLGLSTNQQLIETWSATKRGRLEALLYRSSGFLDSISMLTTITTITKGAKDDNSIHNQQEIYMFYYDNNSVRPIFCYPRYKTPLSIDYFGLLKRLSKNFVRERLIWEYMMEDMTDQDLAKVHVDSNSFNLSSATRHASILSEISIYNITGLDKWLPLVDKFQRLEKLEIQFWEKCLEEAEEKLYQFVQRHKVAFPKLLKEIVDVYGHNTEFVMRLNILLGRPEKFELVLFDGIEKLLVNEEHDNTAALRSNESNNNNDNNINSDNNLKLTLQHVKQFDFSEFKHQNYGNLESVEVFSFVKQSVRYCRRLETLCFSGGYSRDLADGWIFDWAPQELRDAETTDAINKEQERIRSKEILSTGTSRMTTQAVIPLKSFIGDGMTASTLLNIMDGFRYTLEHIDFNKGSYPKSVGYGWTWVMPRLKSLILVQCTLPFCKLKMFCPVLEELKLRNMESPHTALQMYKLAGVQQYHPPVKNNDFNHDVEIDLATQPWRALPTTLKVFHLKATSKFLKLDLSSVGELNQLEDLYLECGEKLDADEQNIFQRLEPVRLLNWDLSNLRQLTINIKPINLDWQRLMLYSAPNLEYFSTPTEEFPVPTLMMGNFWFETRLQTLDRICDFECEINKYRPEDLQHLQSHQEEEKEKTNGSHSQKYRTLEGEEIWNAHMTKIRSLEFGVPRSPNCVEVLEELLQSECLREMAEMNDIKNNNLADQASDELKRIKEAYDKLLGQICFPNLQYLKLSMISSTNQPKKLDGLVKILMQRRGMVRVDIQKPFISHEFEETLEKREGRNVPSAWESDIEGKVNEKYYGCTLTIRNGSGSPNYYRLKKRG